MKLWEVFRFEFGYQARRPATWIVFAALVVVVFLITRDNSVAEALLDDFFINSPFAVAKSAVLGSLFALLIGAFVAGEAAARDVTTGMHPLTYTAPVDRAEYLGGRFLAAFVLNAGIFLAIPVGALLAVYLPGVESAAVGPFRVAAFAGPYLFIALPNALTATAIQFAWASWTGRPTSAYLGSIALFFTSWIVAGIVYVPLGRPDFGRMLDAIGAIHVIQEMSLQWTPAEKSIRPIALEGSFLWNRLLWVGIALGAFAVTWLRFRFAHPVARTGPLARTWRAWRSRRGQSNEGQAADRFGTRPTAPGVRASGVESPPGAAALTARPRSSLAFRLRQVAAIAGSGFRAFVGSWGGLATLVGLPALAFGVAFSQTSMNGVPLVATTARMIAALTAPLADETTPWMIVPLLLIFLAGEYVWRERDAGIAEITDAMPVPDWVPLLGKVLGLGLILATWTALIMSAGLLVHSMRGDGDIGVELYLLAMFGLQLPEYLLFAVLAVVLHVLVDRKAIGHLVAVIAYVFIAAAASMVGVEHDLLLYAAGPDWSYTDMRGFGASLGPWLWFKLYWVGWALLLVVAARVLWGRGREDGFGPRLVSARARLTGPTLRAAAVGVVLVVGLGGFVFYNTNVLNDYQTPSEAADTGAEYERRYGRYEGIPQPRIAATSLRVEIHPRLRSAEVEGSYELLNSGATDIDSVHVDTMRGVETHITGLDRPANLVVDDPDLGHRIYALETPLQPGNSLSLSFEVRVEPGGFTEAGADLSIVPNGTYFTSVDWFPRIGVQSDRMLVSAAARRARGLAPRDPIPALDDAGPRTAWAGRIAFDAVVGTDVGQTAVAPGVLQRSWTENGRAYFHYASDAPVGYDQAFFSADYAVREGRWNEVDIRIFHDPRHDANLASIEQSVSASLDYHTQQFGPYPWDQLTLVERPGLGIGMSANSAMIHFQEGFSLWRPEGVPGALDLPYAVVAHEVAHEWWGAQLPYAFVEGAAVLSESLAWYSAMKVVEETRGRAQLRRLLRFMRLPFPYPPIRRGEPLLRARDPYLAYRKGPFAMFALSEAVGDEPVNTALRRLLETHRSGAPPLATTRDLYRELQAVTPGSSQSLLHDLFVENTFWELRADRVTAEPTTEGAWQVRLEVTARKVMVSMEGVETERPMDAWVEIGVFGAAEAGRGELSRQLYLEKHRIRSGPQTITVTVPGRPVLAGIDPHHVLDWEEREDDDNIAAVRAAR